MIRTLLGIWLFTASLSMATTIEGTISHVDLAKTEEEETLLYISDGSVIKLQKSDNKTFHKIVNFYRNRQSLRLKVSEERKLLFFEPIRKREKGLEVSQPSSDEYIPTIIESEQQANQIFIDLKDNPNSWSQCYNRAHVWAYESKAKHDLNSLKVFLFFTRRYIREYNFGWWFHVAPYAFVKKGDAIEEKVLDNSFTRGPTSLKPWTDIFMRNKVTCPEITSYSEYESNQETNFCYLAKTPMYYLQPLDLENLEQTGQEKTKFLRYEINRAYRNAFRSF